MDNQTIRFTVGKEKEQQKVYIWEGHLGKDLKHVQISSVIE